MKISWLAIESVSDRIDNKYDHNFEVFGLDFMLDENA
jgi:hypothetical protein